MAEHSVTKMPLICIDASKNSMAAFEWFLENVFKEGDTVGLVHIHVPPDLPSLGLFGGGLGAMELYKESLQESIDASRATTAKYKDICKNKGIKFKAFVESVDDSIGHTICKIAKENNMAFIVIGQRGLGAFRRTFFGSVSEYVLHHSHHPVIVVPLDNQEKKQ